MKKLLTTIAITGALAACNEPVQYPSYDGCRMPQLHDSTVAWFHWAWIGIPPNLTKYEGYDFWFLGYSTDEIEVVCINAPDTCLDTTWFWDGYLDWPTKIICDFDSNHNCIPDILEAEE